MHYIDIGPWYTRRHAIRPGMPKACDGTTDLVGTVPRYVSSPHSPRCHMWLCPRTTSRNQTHNAYRHHRYKASVRRRMIGLPRWSSVGVNRTLRLSGRLAGRTDKLARQYSIEPDRLPQMRDSGHCFQLRMDLPEDAHNDLFGIGDLQTLRKSGMPEAYGEGTGLSVRTENGSLMPTVIKDCFETHYINRF